MICPKCKRKAGAIGYACAACKIEHCVKCRMPEDHDCKQYDNIKRAEREKLAAKLTGEASKETHRLHKI